MLGIDVAEGDVAAAPDVDDLVRAYEVFLERGPQIGVYNMGGGPSMTLSLIELVRMLERLLGRPVAYDVAPWRPSDQKVYVSRIEKARTELGWAPHMTPDAGVGKLLSWAQDNRHLFAHLRQ